jgi:ribosomal RNA-processing protein 17
MPPSLKRKRGPIQVAEITFDPAARQEYLTGFHKRKQQRIENAREAAQKREKEDRVRERRQVQ